jgi:DNA-binding beta-propeller fold protein YncE
MTRYPLFRFCCYSSAEGDFFMRRVVVIIAALLATGTAVGSARQASTADPYKVLKTAKTGGLGGFDYIYADVAGRRLYIPRGAVQGASPSPARITVFNLDTLAPAGEIANTRANGAAVDVKSGHGFASSKPVAMWDARTLAIIKTIDVQGNPDGILDDPFNQRVYVFSHAAPHVTVIDAKDGALLGTIDLGGAPEQAATDDRGHIYVDVSDKSNVAVIDAKTMTVTAHYDLGDKGSGLAGLALDVKNHVLFVACRNSGAAEQGGPLKPMMVILNAEDGKIITSLPLAGSSDGAVFNPATMEAFSSHGNGTMTIVKESSPTSFEIEQTLETMVGAKTLTLDSKTNHILTMAAEYGPAPAPATPPPTGAPAGRGARGPMLPDSFSILVVGK